MGYGRYFDLLGIEPTPFIIRMRGIVQDDGRFDAMDYARYEEAMEAIYSRKPERMSRNGLDMLRAKVVGISDTELGADAAEAFRALSDACAPTMG